MGSLGRRGVGIIGVFFLFIVFYFVYFAGVGGAVSELLHQSVASNGYTGLWAFFLENFNIVVFLGSLLGLIGFYALGGGGQ